MVAGFSVQPIGSLLAYICALLRDHPGDLPTIYECRLALTLALHPEAGSRGQRALWQESGLGRDTLVAHLPEQGQRSPHGLLYCAFRGRDHHHEDGQAPGIYQLATSYAEPTPTEIERMTFADPAKDGWDDHRIWALALLLGPSGATLTTAEFEALVGSRTLGWRVFHRMQARALAFKPQRGQITLLLERASDLVGDPDLVGTRRKNARFEAVRQEGLRWARKKLLWLRERHRVAMTATRAGRAALARFLGYEPVEEDLTGYPDWMLLPEERRILRT